MSEPELPEEVQELIRSCVPTLDALEVLMLLVGQAERDWTPRAIGAALMGAIREPAVREYLAGFAAAGLVAERSPGVFLYQPRSAREERAAQALTIAYRTRPVTLIFLLYSIARSSRIQSFSDAFRLRKTDESES